MCRWAGGARLNRNQRGAFSGGRGVGEDRTGAMKLVDMDGVELVHSGREWDFPEPPCSREMIRHLERNERFVTWLQPRSGQVQDQFPAIRTRHGYCTMSLRMMKAVWYLCARLCLLCIGSLQA